MWPKKLIPYYQLRYEAREAANRLIECWKSKVNVRSLEPLQFEVNMSSQTETTYQLYPELLRRPIEVVKWMGVVGMIMITLSLPLFGLASMNWSENRPVDYELTVEPNETACTCLKHFHLKDNVILSVCNRGVEIVYIVDIRLFLNGQLLFAIFL